MLLRRLDFRFIKQIKTHWKALLTGLTCTAAVGGLELLSIAFIYWTTDAIAKGNIALLGWLCIAVIGLYIVKYGFTYGQTYFLSLAAQSVTADLRRQLFSKLHDLPMSFFNRQRVGAIQSILTNDVAVLQNGVSAIRDVVSSPIQVIGGIAALFILSWKLALVALIGLPPIAIAIRLTAKRVRRAQDDVQQKLADMTAVTQESLSSVRVVKAFAAEEREKERFGKEVFGTLNSSMRLVRRIATLKPLIELIGAVALAATMWYGGYLVASGEMVLPALFAFGFTLDKIVRGATAVGNIFNTYSSIAAATDRLYREVIDVETDIREIESAIVIPKPKGRIEFHDVSFTYPDGTEALKNISFSIEPGRSTALVGRSGAGKSTIADLILRFYDPTSGAVFFDGIDLRKLKISWLRQQIGVVPQQTLLFAGTIRENIAYGNPNTSEEEIRQAACAAHAHEFIERMPKGYDTRLGERGVRLSGGEMQRIAIARALLMNPKLLILDEATSSLDPVSEQLVQEAIDEIMHERTTLLIAHRLNTAARADQIIVLSRGRIVEIGSHQQLLAANGTYAGMFKAFSTGVFDGSLD